MKLVVGLGNLGKTYLNNRHNAGFLFVDWLASDWQLVWSKKAKWQANWAKGQEAGTTTLLLKPQTYMNQSGQAVLAVMTEKGLSNEDLVVVHDDLDIPLGEYRLQINRGSAGHKGVESIVACLGNQDFTRIRLGIGRPVEKINTESYVLGDFSRVEKKKLEATFIHVRDQLIPILKK